MTVKVGDWVCPKCGENEFSAMHGGSFQGSVEDRLCRVEIDKNGRAIEDIDFADEREIMNSLQYLEWGLTGDRDIHCNNCHEIVTPFRASAHDLAEFAKKKQEERKKERKEKLD